MLPAGFEKGIYCKEHDKCSDLAVFAMFAITHASGADETGGEHHPLYREFSGQIESHITKRKGGGEFEIDSGHQTIRSDFALVHPYMLGEHDE